MARKYVLQGFLGFLFAWCFAVPLAAAPIELAITSRPPYYKFEAGAVTGIIATPVAQVFKAAGVEFRWVNVASNRQLKVVKDNQKQVCAVGWFKNPKREKFAKFTEFVYQNKPLIAMVRADNRAVTAHSTLREVMKDRSLRMGRKLGYSYGATVDGLVDELAPTGITTSQGNLGMTRMLIGGRFDYFISSPEEGEYLIDSIGAMGQDVVMVRFEDLPPGNKRYVLCSHSVNDETIEKLNAVIRAKLH